MCDCNIFTGATLAPFQATGRPYGMIASDAVVVSEGVIAWSRTAADTPSEHSGFSAKDVQGRLVTLEATRRAYACRIALTTDGNPGSSPLTSLMLAMNMGCTLFWMTPKEALACVTLHAAKALGLTDTGVTAPSMRADLAIRDVQHPAELSYRIGVNPVHKRISGGHA